MLEMIETLIILGLGYLSQFDVNKYITPAV